MVTNTNTVHTLVNVLEESPDGEPAAMRPDRAVEMPCPKRMSLLSDKMSGMGSPFQQDCGHETCRGREMPCSKRMSLLSKKMSGMCSLFQQACGLGTQQCKRNALLKENEPTQKGERNGARSSSAERYVPYLREHVSKD